MAKRHTYTCPSAHIQHLAHASEVYWSEKEPVAEKLDEDIVHEVETRKLGLLGHVSNVRRFCSTG